MERSRSSADIIGVFQRQFRDLQKQIDTLRNYDRSIPDWRTLTLTSAWVPYSAEPGARYWRDAAGIVRLHGIVKNGTLYPNVMFNLPVGFRPITVVRFAVPSNSAFGYFQVEPTGNGFLVIGNNTWVDLSGVSFRAEQ